MAQALELLLKYPLIKKKSTEASDEILFEGLMFVNHQDYAISVEQTTTIDDQHSFKLKKLLHKDKPVPVDEINQFLCESKIQNVVELLDQVQKCLEAENPLKPLVDYSDIYRKVLNEYSEFTKFFLTLKSFKLKEDLTKIYVSVSDEKHRVHSIEISVSYTKNTTEIFEISVFDLPHREQDKSDIFKPNDSLNSLFDQFLAKVEVLQPYFDIMEEFDRNCTVLDPEKPKRQDAYRRIWLGDNISTIITVDPYNIFQRPDIRFLGPDRLTEPYSTRLNENLGNWVCQNDIFQGVLDLLGLEQFPQKLETVKEVNLLVEYGECSICFSLRLNEKLPEIICTNKSCELFFHTQCLYEWLVSLNAKRVFNNISGNCPNCEKTISCPVLD